MAYTYTTTFRLTPPAGAQVTYSTSAWTWVLRQEMREAPLISEQEMLDFTVEQTRYGWRRQVFLDFHLTTDATSNETDLMEILRRAVDDEWLVELSLDSGTTYREVVLSSFDISDADGKKPVGRIISTVWTVKDMQAQPQVVFGGLW